PYECLQFSRLLRSFLLSEREAEAPQEGVAFVVVLGRGRDRHVEPAHGLDVVVVDLREDELLADADRVVARAVERLRREAAEVADTRDGDRDQAVEELPHPVTAQRDARTDGHALAELEAGDRLAGLPHLGALAGDRRQLLDRAVERLRLDLRVANAHVERDLRQPRDAHDRAEAEVLLELGPELLVVALLEARALGCRRGGHYLSISWRQPSRRQTRPLIGASSFRVFNAFIERRSGAGERMFMEFSGRGSRATGPNMRVPRGFRAWSLITAAFSSKAICVPSSRP